MARLVALVLVAATLPAVAQPADSTFARDGRVALAVGIEGAALEPVLGGVGVRYGLSDQTVVGAAVGLRLTVSDLSGEEGAGSQTQEGGGLDASAWLERHLVRRSRSVSPFVAVGLEAGYGWSESQSTQTQLVCRSEDDCDVRTLTFVSSADEYHVGGAVGVGAEVRLARAVTLGAASTLRAGYTWTDNTARQTVEGGDDERFAGRSIGRFDLGTGATSLVLSVYL